MNNKNSMNTIFEGVLDRIRENMRKRENNKIRKEKIGNELWMYRIKK